MKRKLLLILILIISFGSLGYAKENIEEENIKQVIKQYFDLKYSSYVEGEYKDISHLLDMTVEGNQYEVEFLKYKIDAMNYRKEYSFEKYPLNIYFNKIDINGNKAEVYINVEDDGVRGHIYPVFLGWGQHEIIMIKKEGKWIIQNDLYTDLLGHKSNKKLKDVEDLRRDYKKRLDKFMGNNIKQLETDEIVIFHIPYDKYPYDNNRAVQYLADYTENRNTMFYAAPNDCTNFASQVIWYGFGGINDYAQRKKRMTSEWYAGSGGGSIKWESVEKLWEYLLEPKVDGPNGVTKPSKDYLKPGDLIQFDWRSTDYTPHGIFDHSVIMYNSSMVGYHGANGTGKFAYYKDLADSSYDIRYMKLTYYHKPL